MLWCSVLYLLFVFGNHPITYDTHKQNISHYNINSPVSGEEQEVPKWPSAYIVKGTITVPYAEIVEPFQTWYDKGQGSSRIDYYNGITKTYQLSKVGLHGTQFKLEPVMMSIKCFKNEGTAQNKILPQSVLPDLTRYKFKGMEEIKGIQSEKWELVSVSETVFTMYLYWKSEGSTKVIVPLRFSQVGLDHHFMDFDTYEAVSPPSDTFKISNMSSCIPMTEDEMDLVEGRLVYSFNPITEYIDNHTSHVDTAWEQYKRAFNKHYSSEEEPRRKNYFRQEIRFITSTNRANLSYSVGVNHMSDYSPDEWRSLTSCVTDDGYFGNGEEFEGYDGKNNTDLDEAHLPAWWDWRFRGAVTTVKDQAQCGSCWCFMTTGTIEGAHFIKTKHKVQLSAQALMDCTWNYGNKGCRGGLMDASFKWVRDHKGIPTTDAYGPYRQVENYCHYKKSMSSVSIKSYIHIKPNCIPCIKQAMIRYGPVAVGMYTNKAFREYKKMIFKDDKCPKDKMNHAMIIVGYGTLDGVDYWLVKNSWGNKWGIDGYGLVDMRSNPCGIMRRPFAVQAKDKMNHAMIIVGYGTLDGVDYWLVKNSWGNKWGIDGYGLVDMRSNPCGIMRRPFAVQG